MNALTTWIKQHALATFIILTFILSWWPWPLYLNGSMSFPLFPPGPLLAALIVVPLTGGLTGLKNWLRCLFHWRVSLRWYLIAIGFPIVLTAVPAVMNVLLGATANTAVWSTAIRGFMGEFIGAFILVALGEEAGFSAYGLPTSLRSRTVLATILLLATLRVVWHLPAFMIGETEWPVALLLFPTQIIFTWLFIRSGGSAFLMVLAHSSIAAIGYPFFTALFSGPELTRMVWLEAAAFVIAAVILLLTSDFMRSTSFRTEDSTLKGDVQPIISS